MIELDLSQPIWAKFFLVSPLVLIGTHHADGTVDMAPKHLALPLSWENFFGFVCSPEHATYRNIQRDGRFGVSFPRPSQLLQTSLAAAPRCGDGPEAPKPSLAALTTQEGSTLGCPLLQGAYLFLECELDRIVDGFGPNSLIAGVVRHAEVDDIALRRAQQDDHDAIAHDPMLVYLQPGRFAILYESHAFPFPKGFHR